MWAEIFTIAGTIISGIIVFVAGQIVVSFYIKPAIELRGEIGRVASALIFYANVYSNPGTFPKKKADEASDELRKRASELGAKGNALPGVLLGKFGLPDGKQIDDAQINLVGLSNGLYSGDPLENDERRKKVAKALGISAY